MTTVSDVSSAQNQYQTSAPRNSNTLSNALSGVSSSESNISSAQDKKQQTEIQELKNKIDQLCSLIGKSNSEIFNILGQNIINEEKISLEECKKRLEALNAAIKDATQNGQLDKEKAAELAKNYVIALNTGWSIEGLKKQNKRFGETTLQQRLISTGCLPKKNNGEYTMKELEDAVELYFDKYFNVQASKAKTDVERQRIAKLQIQTFGRLLINTKGKDREIFSKVVANLLQENRLNGTMAIFTSTMTDKQKQVFAEKLHQLLPSILQDLSDDDSIKITISIVANLSPEQKELLKNHFDLLGKEFFDKYTKDEVEWARNWYQDPNHTLDDVPTAYKSVCEEYAYLLNTTAGTKGGLAIKDKSFTEDQFFKLNNDFDKTIRAFGREIYNSVQIKTAEIIEKYPEFLNMSKDEVVAFMDKVSDGQFSTIVKESGIEQNLIKGDAASSTGLGFEQHPIDAEKTQSYFSQSANDAIQKMYKQEKLQHFFVVEKNSGKKENAINSVLKFKFLNSLSGSELLEGIANKYVKFSEVLNKYNELTQSGKDFINNFIESMSTGIQNYFLNGLNGNVVLAIAKHTNIDFSKLKIESLSFDEQNLLNQIIEDKKMKKEVVPA